MARFNSAHWGVEINPTGCSWLLPSPRLLQKAHLGGSFGEDRGRFVAVKFACNGRRLRETRLPDTCVVLEKFLVDRAGDADGAVVWESLVDGFDRRGSRFREFTTDATGDVFLRRRYDGNSLSLDVLDEMVVGGESLLASVLTLVQQHRNVSS